MPMGGQGPWAIAVMWVVTALTLAFVVLRIYTRAFVVQSYGIDDHVYNLAFAFLVLYTTATTVSAHYGFGQNMTDIADPEHLVLAILFEAIGQTFAVIGMAIAKWSLGLFLLRLVTQAWHKVAIWVTMAALAGASFSTCFVFWLQCTPPAYLWDRRIPGGYCQVDATPVSLTLTITCVIADFFFAIFPWVFLWNLQMNKREKIVIAASMSLGLIAGACGIKRTLEVPNLSSNNYLYDTVGLIVWSAAEIAVTMVCIGIPICRPLYKQWLDKLFTYGSGNASGGYKKQSGNGPSGERSGPRYGLRTFGGSTMPGTSQWRPETTEGESSESDIGSLSGDGKDRRNHLGHGHGGAVVTGADKKQGDVTVGEVTLGINGPFNEATAVGGADWKNGSEEEILGSEFRTTTAEGRTSGGRRNDLESGRPHVVGHKPSIQVTEEWRVESSTRGRS